MGEVARLFGGGHGGDQGAGVGDAVLQLEHDGEVGGRCLVAGEGDGALAVEVFVDGVKVSGDGFGFLRE